MGSRVRVPYAPRRKKKTSEILNLGGFLFSTTPPFTPPAFYSPHLTLWLSMIPTLGSMFWPRFTRTCHVISLIANQGSTQHMTRLPNHYLKTGQFSQSPLYKSLTEVLKNYRKPGYLHYPYYGLYNLSYCLYIWLRDFISRYLFITSTERFSGVVSKE